MKLFRNQSQYNKFNKSLCEVFDIEYVEVKLTECNVTQEKKVVLGFEFQKGNQFGKLQAGVPKSKEHCEKLRQVNLGKKMSKESSEKKRVAMLGKTSPNKGKKLSDEWRYNMSLSHSGKEKTETHIQNLAKHLNKLPQLQCPHCGKIGRHAPMKRWHFDNCKFII